MRCSCKECGTYMVQADSEKIGCVCPDCGYRCNDCLGTNTVVSREALRNLAFDRRFSPETMIEHFIHGSEGSETTSPYGYASEDHWEGPQQHTLEELRGDY